MHKNRKKNTRSKQAFTLIEVMVTVIILAFGIVAIYQALFISIDTYSYYTHYLNTQDWINEKIWKIQDDLTRYKELTIEKDSGQFTRGQKRYNWVLTVNQLDEVQGLYRVNVTLSWKEGDKNISTYREAFLLPFELKKYEQAGVV